MPAVCVCVCFFFFNFVFNLVWLAVNGAWLVWGINDMTRDTPLLEFSQVRATPIDATPPPLCLPSCWMKASLFFPLFFVVLSTYQRKRWTQKGLLGGIWRWARGKEGVPFRCGGEQRSLPARLNAWGGLRVSSSGRMLGVLSAVGPTVPSGPSTPWLSPGPSAVLSYRLSPSGFGEGGCRRRGAAPQWISGWHGGGSLLGVCALPRVPACLF